ncbi:Ig-like domain-containing protein [Paenibacillus macquariensis]|uniref:Repeat-containing protein n=1 Tax=Paenibacillus macquariensis TaxID=948756 RepID=A0ABY1K6Q2_9BACL|nr:Ig-like domain-containing protein [Paenibacillus macquariensis]MEC0092574.1 Ig-like domain-containing protein [Paenibacillus macquariensis]OAB35522.1 hypothetical protein PMSM_09735 [Paenibacillus macquariensis subsp. macquariensis]SIR34329.1 repeat-containing protein [Paenibacillus macquariensis]
MRKKISIGIVLMMVVNMLLGAMVSVAGAAAGGNPIVITMEPTNGAKGVPVDTKQIQLTFDRNVKMSEGVIEVSVDKSAAVVTQSITAQPYVIRGYDVTIPTNTLVNGTTYHVKIKAGTFVEASTGLNPNEDFDMSFTTLSTQGSITQPVISVRTPDIGKIVSGDSTYLKITFDKAVVHNTGSVSVIRASDNQILSKTSVEDASIKIDSIDKSVSWTVTGLSPGERYYVLIDKGAFKDIDDHLFAGINSAQEWYFNVKGNPVSWDVTVPTVPAANVTGIATTGSISLNFSRPVYPDKGIIFLETEGKLVKGFEVTSSDVKGGGTNKITLTLPTNMSYNKTYTVTVPEGSFKDSDNNAPLKKVWSFTTGTTTSTVLTLSSLSPNDRSTNNGITTSIEATFSRNIAIQNASGVTLKKQGTTTAIPASVIASGKQLIIRPSANLQEGTTYYVDITNGAITDLATGELFVGLSGTSGWTFQTMVSDKTAPVIQNATMYSNSVIRLQYNKTLDSSINLLTSSFNVTVNGETRPLSSAYVSGESVYVTLVTGVAVGQVVRITYTGNSVRPIQDLSKNIVASLSSKEVTNGIDTVLPKPTDGYVSGSTLTLTFSESLNSLSNSSYAYNQFSVIADGYSKGISSIYQSGRTVTLYLSSSVSNGEIVKVSYSPGSYPLQDYRGQNISAFNDYFVRNAYDTKPPELTGIEGSSNKVILTYNEALRTSGIPMKSQFSVLVNNAAVYVTNVEILSNQVFLTLASSFTADQGVTLSYVSGVGGIADLNGNLAGYINLQPINYSLVAEGIRSATVRGDTITIVYNKTLKSMALLPVNQFYVSVDKADRGVQTATVSGDTVTLKLSSAVTSGQVVLLSYMTGSTPLYDNQGNIIKAYNGMPVQNLSGAGTTTGNVNQPDYITVISTGDFGKGGYLLNSGAAQASESRSRSGQSIRKYTLDQVKVLGGLKYITNNNVSKMLVFEVPSTEKAAEVTIPLSALMEVYSTGKSSSIAIRYKDVMYELPIDKIGYTEIARVLGTSSLNTVNLTIQMESVPRSRLSVVTSNNGVTTTPLVDPIELFITAHNGSFSSSAGAISHTGQLYLRASSNLASTKEALLVKYNAAAGSLSFVPSSVTGSPTAMLFSGKVSGNSVIGPAIGYSYYSDTMKHWAKEAILELSQKLIVESRPSSGDKFEPDKNITRAEFAVFIAKGLGLAGEETSRFPDVTSGTTGAYIGAAAKAGIITGNSDGTFKPNSNVTREQMALMMVRAMEYAGPSISLNGTSAQTLARFKDAAKIQSKDLVAKAVKEGIIQGITINTFQPQGNATRAQAAVMLKRVLDKLKYL